MSSSNPIIGGGVSADLGQAQHAPMPPAAHGGSDKGQDDRRDPDRADLRLTIEEDDTTGPSGTVVYKTIDRRTGEVVSRLPAEQVLRLGQASDYVAGAVIKTRA